MRSCGFSIIVACLILSACSQRQEPSSFDIPLVACEEQPCLDVMLNDKPFRLLLDLTNPVSEVNEAAIKDLGVHADADTKISETNLVARVSKLRVGHLVALSQSFLVSNSTQHKKQGTDNQQQIPATGSISYSIFGDRRFIFDWQRKCIHVFHQEDPSLQEPNAQPIETGLAGDFGPPILQLRGFVLDGHPVSAILDTLYLGGVIVVRPVDEPLSPINAVKSGERYHGEELESERLRSLSFAGEPLLTRQRVSHLTDTAIGKSFDIVVGMSILKDHAFGFDFRKKLAWIPSS